MKKKKKKDKINIRYNILNYIFIVKKFFKINLFYINKKYKIIITNKANIFVLIYYYI